MMWALQKARGGSGGGNGHRIVATSSASSSSIIVFLRQGRGHVVVDQWRRRRRVLCRSRRSVDHIGVFQGRLPALLPLGTTVLEPNLNQGNKRKTKINKHEMKINYKQQN